jgi:hypothetical protein
MTCIYTMSANGDSPGDDWIEEVYEKLTNTLYSTTCGNRSYHHGFDHDDVSRMVALRLPPTCHRGSYPKSPRIQRPVAASKSRDVKSVTQCLMADQFVASIACKLIITMNNCGQNKGSWHYRLFWNLREHSN